MSFILPFFVSLIAAPVQEPAPVRKVAILPWSLKDGTETAMKTARETVQVLFEKAKFELVSSVQVKSTWEDQLRQPVFKEIVSGKDSYPDLPTAENLLALGKALKVDIVCAGRASWHTKSVWVGLGPKTKADCTVDMLIIDVNKSEVALTAEKVKSDSTRVEKGIETAASLLVSFGFTALSGGPKTPHQQRSAQNAIALAMEPWLKINAQVGRKIGR